MRPLAVAGAELEVADPRLAEGRLGSLPAAAGPAPGYPPRAAVHRQGRGRRVEIHPCGGRCHAVPVLGRCHGPATGPGSHNRRVSCGRGWRRWLDRRRPTQHEVGYRHFFVSLLIRGGAGGAGGASRTDTGFWPAPPQNPLVGQVGQEAPSQPSAAPCPTLPHHEICQWGTQKTAQLLGGPTCPTVPHRFWVGQTLSATRKAAVIT